MSEEKEIVEFLNIEELTKFVNKKFLKTGKRKKEFAEELGISTVALYNALNVAKTAHLGTKKKVLEALGFELIDTKYQLKKIN